MSVCIKNPIDSKSFLDREKIADLTVLDNPAKKRGISGSSESQNNPYGGTDPLVLAYLLIFSAVQIGRDSAQIQAKDLQTNAVAQNNMINLEAQQNFLTLKWSQLFSKEAAQRNRHVKYEVARPGSVFSVVFYTYKAAKIVAKQVAQTVLQKIESQNQEVSAIRGVMEDKLNVMRQNAQVAETNLNSEVDEGQQSVQQGGSLMQMLTSLTSQISRI